MSESKGMTNNNKTVARGPLWEIFSTPLKMWPKDELSRLFFIKKAPIIIVIRLPYLSLKRAITPENTLILHYL